MSRRLESCPRHWGFPAGNCARCQAGPVMAVPVAGSVKRMFAARTSAQDRAAREQHTQEAAQRAQALRESVEKENAPEGRTGPSILSRQGRRGGLRERKEIVARSISRAANDASRGRR